MNAKNMAVDTETLLQIAHEHSPDGITILRPVRNDDGAVVDFTWLYQNKSIARLNGTETEEVIGKRLLELFPGHAGTTFMEKYIQAAETGTTCIFEEAYEGESITSKTWFRIVVVPANGDIAVLAQNITQQKELEESLRRALVEAERANRAKSEFLATMSHDFRTPLNAVIGFTDMMRQKAFGPIDNEHYEEYVEYIHNSSLLLISLVNDVLDLSKIETGKYSLKDEIVNIGNLAQNCTRQISASAHASGVNIIEEIPDTFPQIRGDERALTQILNNLLSNAVRFTPEDGTVSVNAQLLPDSGIVIRVTDTGEGMSEQFLKEVLAPFDVPNSQIARPGKQTGIGLIICQRFMNLFGGAMNIESAPGSGTRVSLSFPPDRTILAEN